MDLRERQNEAERPRPAGDGNPGSDNLDSLSSQADRMLAAADSALDRVLSGDSERFLRANQQHGGQ